ncbi:MAG: hypothetical protein ND895_15210 [Pyrinomonadaceae bacterium]|nr:hypothetical protein [Pyrinomonadaceae bacterium]
MLFLQARPQTLLLLIMFGVLLMVPAVGQDKPGSATDEDPAAELNPEKLLVKKEAARKTTTSAGSADSKDTNASLAASPENALGASSPHPQQSSGGDPAELAKKLANPLASLISFPMQNNFDFRMGTGSGWRYSLNLQPVIPVALNPNWNMISRTIIPIIHQGNVTGPGASQSGLGDIVQSIFISPNKSEPFIWGAGPVVLVPTATNKFLGGKQLGLGPTVVALKQQNGWTAGVLWNHIWRVAGGSGRPKVNSDFVQPFLSYATKDGWSYTLNTESTYDWTGNHWSVPIHFQVAKVVRFGKQPISFGGALRCWATTPSGGPEGCGPRIVITGIFPKKK